MTYKQFLTDLSNTERKWSLEKAHLRTVTMSRRCPICQLAKEKDLGDFANHQYISAAKKLKLPAKTAHKIAHAADRFDNFNFKVRQDLLKATGVQEMSGV